ncbi:MAG: PAS domain S-box protein [Nitrospinae bacterium]|nr:PAS domain S-box protein [Nitrospinota bacterium]
MTIFPAKWRRSWPVRFWTRSIRRQLMLGIMTVHAVLMSIFVYDMVGRQREFLHKQSVEQAKSLAETLAANSVSWVLASDVVGMEEVIQSVRSYPDLKFAMLFSTDGQTLAHTERKFVGLYVSDPKSLSLLKSSPATTVLTDSHALVDVAVPIVARDLKRHIGWARVGLGQEGIAAGLRIVTLHGLTYTAMAIGAGMVFAFFMALGLTIGLRRLVDVTGAIMGGRRDARVSMERTDELGQLGHGLNQMLDFITEGEEKVQNLLDSTAEGIFGLDENGDISFINPSAMRLLSYPSREDILGKNVHDTVHYAHADRTPIPIEDCRTLQAIRSGEGIHVDDAVFWRMDDTCFDVEYWARPVQHEGRVTGAVVTFMDITERKRAEEALVESKNRLQQLIEASPVAMVISDKGWRNIFMNRKFTELFGYTLADIPAVEQWWPMAYPDESYRKSIRKRWEALVDKAVKERSAIAPMESRVTRRDGGMVDIVFNFSSIGELGLTVFQDITERKRTEEELKRLYTAIEQSSDVVVIADVKGNIEYVNNAFERSSGYTKREAVGKNPRIIKSGKHDAEFYKRMWGALASGRTWSGHLINRNKDGALYEEYSTITPIVDSEGGIVNYVAIKKDISRESTLNRARDFFTRITSHELRTPLTKLMLVKSFIAQGALEDIDTVKLALDEAIGGFQRISHATSLMSELSLGTPTERLIHGNFNDLLQVVMRETQIAIEKEERKVTLTWDTQGLETETSAPFDFGLMRHALDEIFSNAIKYTPNGGNVNVSARVDDGFVVVEVADEGPGIPAELVEKVFDPYFSLENPLEHSTGRFKYKGGGIGLGLTIAQMIVKYHGGSIKLGPNPGGKGLLVAVRLPVERRQS